MKGFRQTFLILTTLLLFTLFIPVSAEEGYRYRGKIIDQEGSPIPEVSIHVYDISLVQSPQGKASYYLKTVKTGKDGSYSIPLYLSSFKFVYEKNGYITETRTTETTFTTDVNLGVMTLKRTIDLTLPVLQRTAYPGMKLTVPFQASNLGEKEESVALSGVSALGWETTIRDELGEVEAISLSPGSTIALSLVANIPMDARGEALVSILARSHVELNRTLIVDVREMALELLSCPYPSRQASPGGIVEFSVHLSNPFYLSYEAKLSVKGLPVGWSSSVLNIEDEWITSVYLPGGGSDDVTLHVEIPQATQEGLYSFEMDATYEEHLDKVGLSVLVVGRVLALGLKTRYPFQMVELGKEVSFPIILENPGETDEAFNLSGKILKEGWQVGFTNEMGAYIQSVLLEARGEETIIVVVKPAADAEPGNYDIRVQAESKNLKGSLLLTVGLMGSTNMKLKIANLYDRLTVGETKTIRVGVENTGYSPLNIVGLETSASLDLLKAECEPIRVMSIEPGETQVFELKVTAQEGTAQGDYLLDVKAVSREMETQPLQMRLTVSASGSQTLVVGVVIAASFASIILVYRKFKRR